MQEKVIQTPILFITFNRLDTTKRVFERIKAVQPRTLYFASDGPRKESESDQYEIQSVRDFVLQNIDWKCEVHTLLQETNLGCKIGVSSAIDWFFQHEERGIILEDDCLPDISFFTFCEELLEKYKDNPQIGAISGDKISEPTEISADYNFSKIPHIWGWATWRRVWNMYDVSMKTYPDFKKNQRIKKVWSHTHNQNYWSYIFNRTYANKVPTWDYQLVFLFFQQNLLCVCPHKNIVSNIGFSPTSTNTLLVGKHAVHAEPEKITFPIRHPKSISYNEQDDIAIQSTYINYFTIKKVLDITGLMPLCKYVYRKYLLYSDRIKKQ